MHGAVRAFNFRIIDIKPTSVILFLSHPNSTIHCEQRFLLASYTAITSAITVAPPSPMLFDSSSTRMKSSRNLGE
jgi:hypothetical protein